MVCALQETKHGAVSRAADPQACKRMADRDDMRASRLPSMPPACCAALCRYKVTSEEAAELRDAILQAGDLRQPVNLDEQLQRSSKAWDSEVSQSLIQLLSSQRPNKVRGVHSSSFRLSHVQNLLHLHTRCISK